MEKRKLRILTVVVFAGVLIFGALRQNSTGRGELGEIQVAMWNLGKVDNLQLSYEYRWKQNGSAGGETMHAWADMLTGDWISEHYTTDEDGTRLYLKQFCDGRNLYHYIDWSGEWEQILPQQRENTVIPDYEMDRSGLRRDRCGRPGACHRGRGCGDYLLFYAGIFRGGMGESGGTGGEVLCFL